MGDYSTYIEQEGCEIDVELLKEFREEIKETEYEITTEQMESLKEGLGEYLDEHKIESYWYPEFCHLMTIFAKAMPKLTEEKWDNWIKMDFQGEYNYTIHFYLEEGKPKVCARTPPSPFPWIEFELTENGTGKAQEVGL